jgi:hypothetical protein
LGRVSALQSLRTEAERGVLSILGSTGFETYTRNGGWWLENLERPSEK